MEDQKNYPRVQAFLDDLQAVYRKHGMSLAHEDSHGAFQVEPYTNVNVDWLNDARTPDTRVVHEADAWIESQWMNKEVYRKPGAQAPRYGTVVRTKWDARGALHCFVDGAEGEDEL